MSDNVKHSVAHQVKQIIDEWRTRMLKSTMIIMIIVAFPVLLVAILSSVNDPGQYPVMVIYASLYLALILITFLPGLPSHLKGWALILLLYLVGIMAFARGGLAGSGREYLILMPVVAYLLVGERTGIFSAVLSLASLALFTFLATQGHLDHWLIYPLSPLDLESWLTEIIPTGVVILVLLLLLVFSQRFQTQILLSAQESLLELKQARKNLEMYQQETAPSIEQSDFSPDQQARPLTSIEAIADLIASTSDIRTILNQVAEEVVQGFDSQDCWIAMSKKISRELQVAVDVQHPDTAESLIGKTIPVNDQSTFQAVVESGQPGLLQITPTEFEIQSDLDFLKERQPRSLLLVPILAAEKMIGLLGIGRDRSKPEFDQDDLHMAGVVGRLLGGAFEKAMVTDEDMDREGESAQLGEKPPDQFDGRSDSELDQATDSMLEFDIATKDQDQQKPQDGYQRFLFDMINDYLQNAPMLIGKIREAVLSADSTQLYWAAEELKTSSAKFGLIELIELVQELETVGQSGDLSNVYEILSLTEREYLNVRETLEKRRSSLM